MWGKILTPLREMWLDEAVTKNCVRQGFRRQVQRGRFDVQMSAREDYPELARRGTLCYRNGRVDYDPEARMALNEIDKLRGDVAKLLSMCAAAGAEWSA
jgi:hypothetical protein